MSERVPDQPAERPMSKAEKRAAVKAAAARAAAAKRRRQALLGAFAGVAVAAVLIGVFVVVGQGSDDDAEPAAAPSAGSTAAGSAAAPQQPTNPAGPQLPPGADPALANKPTVAKGTGKLTKLTATPLIKGTGPAAKAGQNITVNYVGAFYATGEEFDASWKRSEPFTFQLGVGQVIQGWDQGLIGATVGSRVQLDIPAELGYGENPGGGRPAGPLRFVVDVLALQ